jgi:hypothetical protein
LELFKRPVEKVLRELYSISHSDVSLVVFNSFELISLTPDNCMQRKGIPMLCKRAASHMPSFYVCPVENVLGCL